MTLRQLLAHPKVKGVAIGACVDGSRWNPVERAHAHGIVVGRVIQRSRFIGWICFEKPSDVTSENLIEELAHLLADTDGIHDKTWRKVKRAVRRRYKMAPSGH